MCSSLTKLATWHEAVAEVIGTDGLQHILPSGYGGKRGDFVERQAWQGDKLLGIAVSKLQMEKAEAEGATPRVGELSSVHSIATEGLGQNFPAGHGSSTPEPAGQ